MPSWSDITDWFLELFTKLIDAIFSIIKEALLWVFDQVLSLLVTIISTLDFDFQQFNPGTYITQLPAEVINIIALVRIPEAIAIVLSAIVIRIILQLIPFVRLGS